MTNPIVQDAPKEADKNKKTYELPAKAVLPPAPERMTLEQAEKQGWSPEEIEMGKKNKMFAEEKKSPEEPKKTDDQDKNKPPKEEKPPDNKRPESIPHPQNKPTIDDFALNETEEKVLRETFGRDSQASHKLRNVSGLYFQQKHFKSRAQAAERERDRALKEIDDLKSRMVKLEPGTPPPQEDPEKEEKPMTRKEFREMMKTMKDDEKNAEREAKDKTNDEAKKINEALLIQENHARSEYPDFDNIVNLGKKLVDRDPKTGVFLNEVNLKTLPIGARKKAFALLRSIQASSVQADQMSIDDYNVADMAYDLGKIALEYLPSEDKSRGPSAEPHNPNAEQDDGGLTPEEEERIKKNESRTGSSASITGSGGRRVLSVEDVTIDDLNAMDSQTYNDFRAKHPDVVNRLVRG